MKKLFIFTTFLLTILCLLLLVNVSAPKALADVSSATCSDGRTAVFCGINRTSKVAAPKGPGICYPHNVLLNETDSCPNGTKALKPNPLGDYSPSDCGDNSIWDTIKQAWSSLDHVCCVPDSNSKTPMKVGADGCFQTPQITCTDPSTQQSAPMPLCGNPDKDKKIKPGSTGVCLKVPSCPGNSGELPGQDSVCGGNGYRCCAPSTDQDIDPNTNCPKYKDDHLHQCAGNQFPIRLCGTGWANKSPQLGTDGKTGTGICYQNTCPNGTTDPNNSNATADCGNWSLGNLQVGTWKCCIPNTTNDVSKTDPACLSSIEKKIITCSDGTKQTLCGANSPTGKKVDINGPGICVSAPDCDLNSQKIDKLSDADCPSATDTCCAPKAAISIDANGCDILAAKTAPEVTFGPIPSPPPPPCAQPLDTLGRCKSITTALGSTSTEPSQFITQILQILIGVAGSIALILIILAGYKLMTSQGKPESIQQAREQLIAAIVGLLFLIFSLVIIQVIGVEILKIPGLTQ